jgi:iron(III) transport system substrate-binding protein
MQFSRLIRIASAATALAIVAAACGDDDGGGAAAPTTTAGGGTTAAAGSDTTGAPSELSGNLVWWSNWTIEQTEAFIARFNEDHPGVRVEYTRSDDAEMYDRFTTESQAGNVDADVVIIGWDGFSREWDGKGFLLRYPSPEGEAYPPELVGPEGAWHTYGSLLEGICYNTERLEELGLDVPGEWEDLADPQYKGEIVMQDILKIGSGAHDLMIETRVYWDDDARWEAFWKGYGANDVTFQTSYTEAQQQLVQGNFAVLGLCYLDYVQPSIDQGAPVVWVPVEPVITVPFTVNIPTGVKNEENAKGFVDFILSEEGQAAVSSIVGQVPARPGAPFPEPAKVAEGIPQQPALGTPRAAEEFENNAEFYVERAKEWFGLR